MSIGSERRMAICAEEDVGLAAVSHLIAIWMVLLCQLVVFLLDLCITCIPGNPKELVEVGSQAHCVKRELAICHCL